LAHFYSVHSGTKTRTLVLNDNRLHQLMADFYINIFAYAQLLGLQVLFVHISACAWCFI